MFFGYKIQTLNNTIYIICYVCIMLYNKDDATYSYFVDGCRYMGVRATTRCVGVE